jgi:hypothetical protein
MPEDCAIRPLGSRTFYSTENTGPRPCHGPREKRLRCKLLVYYLSAWTTGFLNNCKRELEMTVKVIVYEKPT